MRERFDFIEGARGIAALQVVVLHFCAAFLPVLAKQEGAAHYSWERHVADTPLSFLIDGSTAVFIFFLMSGFVLAPSFLSTGAFISQQITKRFLRLYGPVFVAMLIAISLVMIFPEAKDDAFLLSGSRWAQSLYQSTMHWTSLVKDVLLNSMLLGYDQQSVFTGLSLFGFVPRLSPIRVSLDPPLWTLHAEFWGSIATIIVAAMYRSIPRRLFWASLIMMFFVTGTSYFTWFLLGFAAYLKRQFFFSRTAAIWSLISAASIIAGVLTSTVVNPQRFDAAFNAISSFTLLSDNPFHMQHGVSAALIMFGIALSPIARALLSTKIPMWLGKISFSMYLLHLPVLFTVGFAVFSEIGAHFDYAIALVLSGIFIFSITFFVSYQFEKYIDRRAVSLARNVINKRVTKDLCVTERS